MKKAIVIGSGFAGLSSACFMAKAGFDVTVIEKNSTPGGRARQFTEKGFTFDMGPSWYWMPDVFENFFKQFNTTTAASYKLQRLDPSYRVYWQDEATNIPADLDQLKSVMEEWEAGSGKKLDAFLREAEYKYNVGINKLVHKPGQSWLEFADFDLFKGIFKLDVFQSMSKHIAYYFKHPKIQQLLEFPVLFLGALPAQTPALYSLMNYADIIGGTWYPKGGIYSVVSAMKNIADGLGVQFKFDERVTGVEISGNGLKKIITDKSSYDGDVFISGADYQHFESNILPASHRSYSESYWEERTMAPSCLIYYVGLNKKLKNITHHSLFFDTSFAIHGAEIYETKQWPADPLFYVSCPSVSDESVAPEGSENLFFLIPIAAGLTHDDEALRRRYFDKIVARFEDRIGEQIRENIVVYRSFGSSDFINDYNSFKGNAYGLANTLMQTAVLKPSCKSKKIKNLFYTGQLTVPGPGVPPALISGEVVAGLAIKQCS